jgi:predicted nucleotidyltransferase
MNEIIKSLKIKEIQQELNNHQIKHIWLVWSYADGTANKDSDIDLLVKIDKKLPRKSWWIFWAKAFLEEKMWKSVDIIIKDSVDKHIKDSLLSKKIAIW